MSRNRVYIELVNDKPIRIFRNAADARLSGAEITEWPRVDAVRSIREQVYKRASGQCERCGKRLSWKQMHMDERVPRGQGGEVSLDNSWCLCAGCHILDPWAEHSNGRLH